MTRVLLKWIERSLLAFGLALGLWCAVILVRAHQTQTMPPPKVTVTQTVLPGTTTSPPIPVPAPAPGTWVARLEVPSVRLATTVLEGTDDGTLSKTLIVTPDDVYVLDPTAQPTLTLVTCYPFDFIGHAPRRFIVQAALVSDEARVAGSDIPTRAR